MKEADFKLSWLTVDMYNAYNLGEEEDLSGVFASVNPVELLSDQRVDGIHWDYLLVLDMKDKPRAIIAIQWFPVNGITLQPMVHYHVMKNSGLWAIRHTVNVLHSIARYYGLDKLTGDRASTTKLGARFNKLVDLEQIIHFID